MDCQRLASIISEHRSDLSPVDVARLCLLLLSHCDDPDRLVESEYLLSQWNSVSYMLDVATDQHAAVCEELDQICGDGPVQFSPDQLWTLLKVVKIQSQLLDLYSTEKEPAT